MQARETDHIYHKRRIYITYTFCCEHRKVLFYTKTTGKVGQIFGKDREDTMPIYTVRLVILYKMFDDMFLSLEAILDGKLP